MRVNAHPKNIFLFVVLVIPFVLFAQEKGKISGSITDKASRAPLVGVTVMVKGTYYGASSNLDGKFSIQNVNPGTYTIQFSLIGYKKVQQTGVKIGAGQTLALNIDMEETELTLDNEIVIIGQKPMFNIEETASRRSVTSEEIEVAVVENIRDVVAQQAGVVQTDNEIHIRGGRTHESAILVDGVSVQDPLSGTGFGLQVSASSIKEVEVLTGGFNAEYGQATSGVIDASTKDGAAEYHGSLSFKTDNFGFNSTSLYNWNSRFADVSLSGAEPITSQILPAVGIKIPGEIFFFMSLYTGITDAFTRWTPIIQGGKETNAYREVVANRLHSTTFFDSRFTPGQENNWQGLGKLTWKITPLMTLYYSFIGSAAINQNSQSLQANLEYIEPSPGYQYEYQNILDDANVYTHRNTLHILRWSHTLSAQSFYKITLSRFTTNLRVDANGKDWTHYREPRDIVTFPVDYYNTNRDTIGVIPGDGFWDVGNGFTWRDHYIIDNTFKAELSNDFSEKNKFKAGFEATIEEMQMVDIEKPWFGELGLNNDIYKVYPSFGAMYAQESITFSGMILNFGLRLDWWMPGKFVDDAVKNASVVTIPDATRQDYLDETFNFFGRRMKARLSPRVGISHPVSDNQTLFFSYGHFSKRPNPQFVYAKLDPASAQTSFPRFGNPNLNPETTVAYELGLRNEFTENDVFTLTAYYKDIFDYVSTRSAKITSTRFSGGRFTTYINQDYARSRGIELEYKKRMGNWFRGSFTATYSIATGKSSYPDEGSLVVRGDQDEQIKENFLIFDRPFQTSLSATFYVRKHEPLFGFADGILDDYNVYLRAFFQSGKRYSPYVLVPSSDPNKLPEYQIDRNNLNGKIADDWFWIDLNFEKYFTFGGLNFAINVEIANLLDNANSAIINPVTGRAYEYGDPIPTGWNDPLHPDLQLPVNPFPYNPARYLAPRNIRAGVSVKF